MATGQLLTLIGVIITATLGAAGLLAVSIRQTSKRIDDTHKRFDDTHRRIDDTNKRIDDTHKHIDESHNSLKEAIETNYNMLVKLTDKTYTALSDLIKLSLYGNNLEEKPTQGLKLKDDEQSIQEDEDETDPKHRNQLKSSVG